MQRGLLIFAELSLGYAGMGAWLERVLRATALGAGPVGDARNSTGSAGERNSFGAVGDRSSLGANSVYGSVGGGAGLEGRDADKVEVDVWCGSVSVSASVTPMLALSAAVAEHSQPLVELLGSVRRDEWDTGAALLCMDAEAALP